MAEFDPVGPRAVLGALVGSTLTSTGAFAALLLHPHPQLRSFGLLVVLALVASLLASVVVLPSLLAVWSRHAAGGSAGAPRSPAPGTDD